MDIASPFGNFHKRHAACGGARFQVRAIDVWQSGDRFSVWRIAVPVNVAWAASSFVMIRRGLSKYGPVPYAPADWLRGRSLSGSFRPNPYVASLVKSAHLGKAKTLESFLRCHRCLRRSEPCERGLCH